MNFSEKQRILITGGAGLVGTYLTKELLRRRKYQITVVDKKVPVGLGVKFVKADFSNKKIMMPLLKKADFVIHLAGMVGVDFCRLNPEKVIKVNYTDTKTLMDWCVESNVKKVIFASSSEIYGNSKKIPFMESNKPSPISTYAKCKLKIERYLKKLQEKSSTKVGIVRLFNVYGPGQKDMVIPLFVEAASKNKPLVVLGNGDQTRTFIYVVDACRAILKVFDYDSDFEIFNLGSEEEIKIIDLARIILKQFPESKSKIVNADYGGKFRGKELEIFRRVPAVEKARSLLNFRPKYGILRGINLIVSEKKRLA